LNTQFKIVHANGKSVVSTGERTNIKRAAALARTLASSLKGSQKDIEIVDNSSRKKSMNSFNDTSGRVGSSLATPDTAKELEDVFNSIDPKVKATFLSVDVRYVMQIICMTNKSYAH